MAQEKLTIILYSPETSQGKSSFAREFLAAAARDGEDYQGWASEPKLRVLGVDRDESREGKEHTLSQWHDNLELEVKMPVEIKQSLNGDLQEYDVVLVDFGGAPNKAEIAQMMDISEGLILTFITFDEKGYRLGINKLRQLSRFQKSLGVMSHVRAGEAQGQSRDSDKLSKDLLFYRDDVLNTPFEHHKALNKLYTQGLLAGMSKKVSTEEEILMKNMNTLWQEVKERYGNPYR